MVILPPWGIKKKGNKRPWWDGGIDDNNTESFNRLSYPVLNSEDNIILYEWIVVAIGGSWMTIIIILSGVPDIISES